MSILSADSVHFQQKKMLRNLLSEAKPFIALAVLLAICAISNEHFRGAQNLINISRQVAYTGIAALGMTYVIIAGGIDLSIGSLFAFSGVCGVIVMNRIPSPGLALAAGLGVMLLAGLLGGALNGGLVTVGKIPPFIATLGTLSIYRSLALYFADAGTIGTPNELFRAFGNALLFGVPLTTWIFFALAVIFGVILAKTPFGRHAAATGANLKAATYAAISVNRVKFTTYLIAGLCAGTGAFLFAGRLNAISSTTAGNLYELDAIAAAIIGGTAMNGGRGTIAGTVAGVFILGIISNALDMWGAPVNLQGLVKGAVIIIAVLIQHRKNQ